MMVLMQNPTFGSRWLAYVSYILLPAIIVSRKTYIMFLTYLQRFTGEIIRDQYQKKFNPPEAWILKHEFQLLDLKKPLSDLDVYDDRLIVLEAVPSSDSERHATRR